MSTATAGYALKAALASAIPTAIAALDLGGNVLIDWGYPEPTWPDDMVLLGALSTQQEWRTSNRSREETLDLELHVLSWRATQQEADTRAYALLAAIERYLRITDPTLGGVVRECVLTATDADGYTRTADRITGRGTEIIATFTAKARISG